MIYLYLKTHNITGLKYLGKTTQDPFKYRGSGTVWLRHLKKYGYDIHTEILYKSTDPLEFNILAKQYSKDLNIVESNDFANLCPEEGQGGHTTYSYNRNKKISDKLKGRHAHWIKKFHNKGKTVAVNKNTNEIVSITIEEFQNNSNYIGIASKNKGIPRNKRKPYNRKNSIVTCPHCHKSGAKMNMTRYHFDNCKFISK